MKNTVSLIVPYFNGDKYFKNLFDSVYNAIELVHDFTSFQIIIVIDSVQTNADFISKLLDNYFGHLKNVQIDIIKNKINYGVAKSRNIGLKIASGDLIHLLDQDDTLDSTFYKVAIPYTTEYNFILVNGNVYYENKPYSIHKLYYFNQELNIKNLVSNDFIRSPGQVLFSKNLLQNIKFPEPEYYKGADDRFFWFKMFYNHENTIKPIYLDKVLYHAFIHDNNYSADSSNLRLSALENWSIFLQENNPNKHLERLIQYDVLSLKFSANLTLSWPNYLIGLVFRLLYYCDKNKIVRFFVKRLGGIMHLKYHR